VFLELVIDPSCSLIFEAEEAEDGVMQRPPRDPQERLFSLKAIGFALLQGATSLAACVAVYLTSRPSHGDDAARALTFTALVLSFLPSSWPTPPGPRASSAV
jgi:Ca2+-transporting ATPase